MLEHAAEILNVSRTEWAFSFMDEIYTYARSSDEVSKSKSTRLHRFRLMSGKDVRASRGRCNMERSTSTKIGQINSWNFKSPTRTENYLGSMENQLCSSGVFSKDSQHCRFSKRFKRNWTLVKQVQKNLKIESSSCQCSTVDWTKKIQKSRSTQKGFPRGHWSFLGPREEDNGVMVDIFKESGHPIFRGISALNRGVLKKVEDVRFTSLRNLQMQSSYFNRFIQQISSISTEQ